MIDADDNDYIRWTQQWPQFTVLSNFTVLKELRIHYSVLFGKYSGTYDSRETCQTYSTVPLWDLLPPNLGTPALCYERSAMNQGVDHNAELRGLLPDETGRASSLRMVEIHYSHNDPRGRFPLHLDTLRTQFEEKGLALKHFAYYYAEDEGKLLG
jgi:hypothetical protein